MNPNVFVTNCFDTNYLNQAHKKMKQNIGRGDTDTNNPGGDLSARRLLKACLGLRSRQKGCAQGLLRNLHSDRSV